LILGNQTCLVFSADLISARRAKKVLQATPFLLSPHPSCSQRNPPPFDSRLRVNHTIAPAIFLHSSAQARQTSAQC